MTLLVRAIVPMLCVAVCGCKTELTNRHFYRESLGSPTDAPKRDEAVVVGAFLLDIPRPAGPARLISSLAPEGQLGFALGAAYSAGSRDGFDKSMQLSPNVDRAPTSDDRATLSRRLVVSIQPSLFDPPADRIEAIRVRVRLVGATFKSIERYQSEFQTVDLGKVTLSQTGSAELALSAGVPSTVAGESGTASLKGSRTLSEEVNLKQEVERLSVTLADNGREMVLTRRSPAGGSVAGNIAIDCVLDAADSRSVTTISIAKVVDENNAVVPPEKVVLTALPTRIPRHAISAILSGEYVYRHARLGSDTSSEHDDWVAPSRMKIGDTSVMLVDADRIAATETLCIIAPGAGATDERLYLATSASDKSPIEIVFSSATEAWTFRDWLDLSTKGAGDSAPLKVTSLRSAFIGRAVKDSPTFAGTAVVAATLPANSSALNLRPATRADLINFRIVTPSQASTGTDGPTMPSFPRSTRIFVHPTEPSGVEAR